LAWRSTAWRCRSAAGSREGGIEEFPECFEPFDFNDTISARNAAFSVSNATTVVCKPSIKPSNSEIRASNDTPAPCDTPRERKRIPHTPRDPPTRMVTDELQGAA